MVQHKTILKIMDNSGAKLAKCVNVLGGFKKKHGLVGDIVLVTIVKIKLKTPRLKITKKHVFKALILQTKKVQLNSTGVKFKFKNNSTILLDKNGNPLATRIFGFVPKKLKIKFYKLMAVSLVFG